MCGDSDSVNIKKYQIVVNEHFKQYMHTNNKGVAILL